MLLNFAQKIVECGRDLNIDIQLRESYCGRGRFGVVTTGIIVDSFVDFTLACVEYSRRLTQDDPDDENGFYDELVELIPNVKIDNMGQGYIIY